jgi:WD40 repeat protein
MFLSKLQAATVMLLGVGALGGGGLLTYHSVSYATQEGGPAKAAQAKPDADQEAIRELIKQLGDDAFDKREAAEKRLAALGEPALELLRQAARDATDAEVRQRAQRAVRAIETALFGQVRRFEGHAGADFRWVGRVVVTPDGLQAVSAGGDGLRCWDLATGKQVLAFGNTKDNYYWSLGVSADGRRLIAGGNANVAFVFDLKTGKPLQQLVGHAGPIWGAVLSADGKRAVTGGWDESLRAWEVETGKVVRAFEGVRGKVRCLALSPDGKFVAAGHFPDANGPGTVRLWDVEKGKEVRAFEGHTQEVSSVAFSPDGKTLLSSGFDRTVRLWEVSSGRELKRLEGHTQRVEYAAFTPDGRRVVSCGNEQNPTLRLWDVASGKQLLESEPVEEGFLSVAVLPDGRHCVTTGKDGVVRLWRWAR